MNAKFGYLLPTRERIVAGIHETDEILQLGDYAEEIGLDSVWVGDSLLAKPRHEPLALLSAIGGRTRQIQIGTAVLLPMLRNPVLLAHQLATMDQITRGRLVVGLGTARDNDAIRREFQAAGVPFEKRIGRMLEQVRLCRALWSGNRVNWDGLFSVDDGELAPKPWTPGGPPLWGGGGVEQALKRAGRYFDGWMPSGAGTPAEWSAKWEAIKTHAKDADRDPSRLTGSAYLTITIDDNVARANRELDDYLQGYYNQTAELIRSQQYCFAGDRAGATDWLGEFVAGGATHLVVRFTGSNDQRQMDDLIEIKTILNQ